MRNLAKVLAGTGLCVIALVGCKSTQTRTAAKSPPPAKVAQRASKTEDGEIQTASYEAATPDPNDSTVNSSIPKSGGINYSGAGTKSATTIGGRPGKCLPN